jgi:ssDNA-binding replication factor A large subunit
LFVDCLDCFVHAVSPVKQSASNKRYFKCTFQTKETTVNAVCFSPEKQRELKNIEQCKSPVRVKDFRTSASYGGKEDLVITKKTSITPLPSTDFAYSDDVSSLGSVSSNIVGLGNIAAEQLVSFKAYVAEISSVRSVRTQSGHGLRKQDVVLSDPTGSIKLTLWEDYVDTLEKNQTYNLENVRLKVSKQERYVNTAKGEKFVYKEATPFEGKLIGIDGDLGKLTESNVCGEIIGVLNTTKNPSCISCSRKVRAKSASIGTCENSSCKLMQKLDNCGLQWCVRVLVQKQDDKSEKMRLTMFNQCVQKLLRYIKETDDNVIITSEEELVCSILESSKCFNITYDNVDNKILDIEPV